ncbi:unnamed protein product [Linum trigynum]|uniref:Uncharacterized protein n=1 Tax=Linum trigynum TaxID=586398 RepID=A0AAV2FNP8_9ROSI
MAEISNTGIDWLKVDIDSLIEYAATIIVNLLTALLMIEDITTLNSGRVFGCPKWSYKYSMPVFCPAWPPS